MGDSSSCEAEEGLFDADATSMKDNHDDDALDFRAGSAQDLRIRRHHISEHSIT
ncbi:hypothetical protein [Rhodococcus sp. IEGM 1379]|uniref:hypothetical protein n=1 Tax=Rhodococcus sp. IEGM 1379 TaxID=3047086 RepID=UPI0024B78117|nr:hypothetical protein [Rhodococcus sp. IEGM 1379]MDI9914486.1 hypothetical protein [Rhodococcus sp. IEGM 1379]